MSIARPILIVEDDEAFREVLVEQIASTGLFRVVEAATLAEAGQHLSAPEARFDAMILDINLPDGDGCDFCAKTRASGYMMPIVMLTGAAEDSDVVRGLEAGANDYIAKPFRWKELLARLQSQLRLYDESDDAVFTVGPFTFRPSARVLVRPSTKQRIHLTAREVEIIRFLYKHADCDVPGQVLLEQIWGYTGTSSHTLQTHIYRLRQKMERDPDHCRLLISSPVGYCLHPTATL